MIELTGIHIGKLNDEDLRELVFRLCKAELRHNHHQSQPLLRAGTRQRQTVV